MHNSTESCALRADTLCIGKIRNSDGGTFEGEARALRQSEKEIHAVHGRAGGSLEKIVGHSREAQTRRCAHGRSRIVGRRIFEINQTFVGIGHIGYYRTDINGIGEIMVVVGLGKKTLQLGKAKGTRHVDNRTHSTRHRGIAA